MNAARFRAVIMRNEPLDAAYVVFPYDLRALWGCGRRHVEVLFDAVPYSGSVVNMGLHNADGSVCYVIGMPKAVRGQLGKGFGDEVEVTVTPA